MAQGALVGRAALADLARAAPVGRAVAIHSRTIPRSMRPSRASCRAAKRPSHATAVAAQYDPLAAQSQRAAGEARAAAAERAAFEGTNVGGAGGAFDASVNSINERAGQAQSALMANLITGELTQRRADVVNAIGFAQGEQKMRLQAQLAALDRELERQRMAQQNQQYLDDLGFQIGDREMYCNERETDRL